MPQIIIEDTRQKKGYHDNIPSFCSEMGIRLIRSVLKYGDYALLSVPEDVEDVDGWLEEFRPQLQRLTNAVRVDTKYGLAEVYNNLVHDHDRVAAECDGAFANGLRLVFLVEEPCIKSVDDVHTWANPRYDIWLKRWTKIKNGQAHGKYMGTKLPRKPVGSEQLEQMMKAFAEHHHCEWRFCSKKDTGRVLMEILSRGDG